MLEAQPGFSTENERHVLLLPLQLVFLRSTEDRHSFRPEFLIFPVHLRLMRKEA